MSSSEEEEGRGAMLDAARDAGAQLVTALHLDDCYTMWAERFESRCKWYTAIEAAAHAHLSALSQPHAPQAAQEIQTKSTKVLADCISPLLDVLAKNQADVDANESQRVSIVLAAAVAADPVGVGRSLWQNEHYFNSLSAKGSAIGAALDKAECDLNEEDALTVGYSTSAYLVAMSRGIEEAIMDGECQRAEGVDWEPDNHVQLFAGLPINTLSKHRPSVAKKLIVLLFSKINCTGRNMCPYAKTGLLWALCGMIMHIQDSKDCAKTLKTLFDEQAHVELKNQLLEYAAADRMRWFSFVPCGILCVLSAMFSGFQKAGGEIVQPFLSAEMPELIAANLAAVQSIGEASANVTSVWYGTLAPLVNCFDLSNQSEHSDSKHIARPTQTDIAAKLQYANFNFNASLHYVIKSNLIFFKKFGWTSSACGTFVAAMLFGSKEHATICNTEQAQDGSVFTQDVLDSFVKLSRDFFLPIFQPFPLPPGTGGAALCLCKSDANKTLLLNNKDFITLLVDGLWLPDAEADERRREDVDEQTKISVQQNFAECLLQLALFEGGKEALHKNEGVMKSLRAVDGWLSPDAKQHADSALKTLQGTLTLVGEERQQARGQHIMISYNWDYQSVVKRIHSSLVKRKYSTWIDIYKMHGSIVETMATAVEQSSHIVYGICEGYKNSTNCKMEAEFAYQQQKRMVPLMLEEGYKADGWLGMMLGARMWFGFYGAVLVTDAAFETTMDELCRELDQVKANSSVLESMPPDPSPATTMPASSSNSGDRIDVSGGDVSGGGGYSSVSFAEMAKFFREEKAESQREAAAVEVREHRLQLQLDLRNLQSRLSILHVSTLLSEDELFSLEDAIGDFIAEQMSETLLSSSLSSPSVPVEDVEDVEGVTKVYKMVEMSKLIASDAMFSRQLKRIFVRA